MADHFNKLTPAQLERLAVLSEELGEAQQAVGKILRHGYDSCNPFVSGRNNREDLEKELGDIVAAIGMLSGDRDISRANVESWAESKRENIKPYLHHQGVTNG